MMSSAWIVRIKHATLQPLTGTMKCPMFVRLCLVLSGLFLASVVQAATLKIDAEPFVPNEDEFAAAIVMVPKTHQVLWSFKPDHARVAASLTKLVNTLVMVKQSPKWDQLVALKRSDEVGGGRLRVALGARLTVRDLLYSAITASANNAANALARVSGLGYAGFIRQMNIETQRLGARHSTFVDAAGMKDQNITTARDMAFLTEAAFRDPLIQAAASAGEYQVTVASPHHQVRTIHNTNKLLTTDSGVWIVGGKTGYLESSKYNFVMQARPIKENGQPEFGKDVIVVILGAPTKAGSFDAARRLAKWTWNNHEF